MRRYQGRSDRKSGQLTDRRLENLSDTVNDLFQKAVQNEQILRRYQQFELKLLDLSGFEKLLDLLLRNSLDYFQLDRVALWLYDPQDTLEDLIPEEYLDDPAFRLLSSPADLNALYGKHPDVRMVSLIDGPAPAYSGPELFAPMAGGEPMRSAALLPLVRHGIIVGSLHFGAKGHQRFTDDKSTDFIGHLASIVAVCFENAVNQERLHRLSMYDMLTQVKNRRAFNLALDNEVSRAARSGDPLSLLFVDIDYFKRVNDTYGHLSGDKVLKEVAQFMDELLRKTDHVCRYGGEEFALLLPNCGQQRAMEIAERIRVQVSELVIACDADETDADELSVTLSIGVCCWLAMDDLSDEQELEVARQLVACSDQGVYQSKAAGRNCTHYVPLQESTLKELAPAS